ncbi:unnamed protein product [Cylicostephanus goldi]|uniref:Uncharacterized protein n=1 Tax=Cylicostephanus goldi TaxID=71465 RepID=A0A3P6T280_CYLGO|nr:unnamed protein product [Cylicostephanus goldi]
MNQSTNADTQENVEDDMILTSKRSIPLPPFKGDTDKVRFGFSNLP